MQAALQTAQNDFAAAVREAHEPGQARYIRDDITQLGRIASEIVRHHEALAALIAGLSVAQCGRGRHAVGECAEIEIDFLDSITSEAGAVVRADVAERLADQNAIAA